MSCLAGLFKNSAVLVSTAKDPRLRPVLVSYSPSEAVVRSVDIIRSHPGWKVVGFDSISGGLHAVHKTRLLGFADDVRVRFEPAPQGCRILARSKSRIGLGDLGQNVRNLKELTQLLQAQLR